MMFRKNVIPSLTATALVFGLLGCSPKEPKETTPPISTTPVSVPTPNPAPIPEPISVPKPATAPEPTATATLTSATMPKELSAITLFQMACSDEITAKMIDPTAAQIAYKSLPQEAGYQAQVTLQNRGGGKTMTFDYICLRAEDGEVITKLISD